MWKTILTIAVCVAAITISVVRAGGEQRTLSRAELWQIFGGETFPDQCCEFKLECNLQGENQRLCSDHNNDQIPCNAYMDDQQYAGNKKQCNGMAMGTSCTQAGSQLCHDQCVCHFDVDTGNCLRSYTSCNSFSSPVSCVDDCPAP